MQEEMIPGLGGTNVVLASPGVCGSKVTLYLHVISV
jgi:hypothetical protein